jgi:hypothetical protein
MIRTQEDLDHYLLAFITLTEAEPFLFTTQRVSLHRTESVIIKILLYISIYVF